MSVQCSVFSVQIGTTTSQCNDTTPSHWEGNIISEISSTDTRMSHDQSLQSLIQNLSPRLNEGEYVFCVDDEQLNENEFVLGTFQESEGKTIVLPKDDAEKLGLNFEAVLSWITLDVHSSLQAVGLTACVSNALAEQGIACNVIAGYHHDHLFVPTQDAVRAMDILNVLCSLSHE